MTPAIAQAVNIEMADSHVRIPAQVTRKGGPKHRQTRGGRMSVGDPDASPELATRRSGLIGQAGPDGVAGTAGLADACCVHCGFSD